jgi:hypothetical protein
MVAILSSGVFDLLPEEQPATASNIMSSAAISFAFICQSPKENINACEQS